MKLAIAVNLANSIPIFSLADLDLGLDLTDSRIILTPNEFKHSNLKVDLSKFDSENVLGLLTEDQFTIAVYFYLRNEIPSKEIIRKWLYEACCDPIISEKTSTLIYNAVINNKDDSTKMTEENSYFEELIGNIGMNSKQRVNTPLSISTVLSELRKGMPIHWLFDEYFKPQISSSLIIDISHLKEVLFQIEDHSNIIIGFGNSCRSMIELLSAYSSDFLEKLCKLIPIGLRDLYSVGSCLIAFPEIMDMIISDGITDAEIYGMDSNGILRRYTKNQSRYFYYSNLIVTGKDGILAKNEYLPLFIKLTK